MTDGERLIWASAYVFRFADIVRDPMLGLTPRDHDGFGNFLSERELKRGVRRVALAAVDFADMAVNSLHAARRDMVRKKLQKTQVYERVIDILDGRY